jgi:hypothetical protein
VPDPAKLRRQTETDLIRTSSRPIYYDCQAALQEIGQPMSLTPLLFRAKGVAAPGPLPELTLSEPLLDAIFRSHPVEEYFLDDLRKGVSSSLMNYFALVDSPQLDRLLAELRASRYYRDTDLLLQQAHNLKTLGKPELALAFYRQAEAVEPKALDARHWSEYCGLLERHGEASAPPRMDCAESRR